MEDGIFYWELRDEAQGEIRLRFVSDLILGNFFSDSFKSMSILGFYVTISFAIGQLLKNMILNTTGSIFFNEITNCQNMLKLCQSIKYCRVQKDLQREQQLYRNLISIYWSPELLIKFTKE